MLPTGDQNGGNLKYDPYDAFQQDTDGTSGAQTNAEGKQAKGVNPGHQNHREGRRAGSKSPWTTIDIADQLPGVAGWWKRGARWNDTTTGTWTDWRRWLRMVANPVVNGLWLTPSWKTSAHKEPRT